MQIIYKKVDELIPYINNPRNNDDAIDKVASSIKQFGFKVPIVIDNGNEIITGHTRLLASRKLGLETVPVIIADDLTEAQVKAFRIADNKVAEYSSWDNDLLRIELEGLEELNFDLGEVGIDFSDFNLPSGDYVDLPEELELERTELGNVKLKCLKFDKYTIHLTDEEFYTLEQKLEEYIDKTGVLQGFITYLLGEEENA